MMRASRHNRNLIGAILAQNKAPASQGRRPTPSWPAYRVASSSHFSLLDFGASSRLFGKIDIVNGWQTLGVQRGSRYLFVSPPSHLQLLISAMLSCNKPATAC